jgi:hypothetical protein
VAGKEGLVKRAVNLDANGREEALELARQRCPNLELTWESGAPSLDLEQIEPVHQEHEEADTDQEQGRKAEVFSVHLNEHTTALEASRLSDSNELDKFVEGESDDGVTIEHETDFNISEFGSLETLV